MTRYRYYSVEIVQDFAHRQRLYVEIKLTRLE